MGDSAEGDLAAVDNVDPLYFRNEFAFQAMEDYELGGHEYEATSTGIEEGGGLVAIVPLVLGAMRDDTFLIGVCGGVPDDERGLGGCILGLGLSSSSVAI